MFQPIRAVRYHVPDLEAAQQWYGRLLGTSAVATDAQELCFDVGAFELRLALGEVERGNAVMFWGVDSLPGITARLQALAAPLQHLDPGRAGQARACTCDPWGNVIGLMEHDDREERAHISQRAAERVALRNVREQLDGLAGEEHRRRRAQRWAGVVVAVLLALAGAMLASLFAEPDVQQRGRGTAKLVVPAR